MTIRVVCDIETDSLDATKIWVIVTKDLDTGKLETHLSPFNTFKDMVPKLTMIVGHNFLGFDLHVLNRLLSLSIDHSLVVDTIVVSRFLNFNIDGGHSLDAWGKRLGKHKIEFNDYSQLTQEMIRYCQQDVEVNYALFKRFEPYIYNKQFAQALRTEHDMAYICHEIKSNGFYFNVSEATRLQSEIQSEIEKLDALILDSFKPICKLLDVRPIRFTKTGRPHGTLRSAVERDYPEVLRGGTTSYVPGADVYFFEYEPFNPGSPKQIVHRLNQAGWKPTEKTKGYLQAERELKQLRGNSDAVKEKRQKLQERLKEYEIYGWKVNEENLETLPETAPESAKFLARRILLASRLSNLTEWLNACDTRDERVHGNLFHIGAWTQRMSHDHPNTANIPSKYNRKGQVALYGSDFRSLWSVPKGRKLIGVDAEGIQLRILAHYIDDPVFTTALVSGDKTLGTDVHTLNAKLLSSGLPTMVGRDVAKTFIYSWLLGAGVEKTAQVLSCNQAQAREAREAFLGGYDGLRRIREEQIPKDASRGYFVGLDGRYVVCDSEHLMLAGYLQNGEAVIMKQANIKWRQQLRQERIPFWQVNFVHDEWQTETLDDDELAEYIAKVQIQAIVDTGLQLNLKCPLAGSRNIGYTWNETH